MQRSGSLKDAIGWIMSDPGNMSVFRANAGKVLEQFPELTDEEFAIIEKLHRQSERVAKIGDFRTDGEGVLEASQKPAARSYGW